ncbi:MAG: two-component sensor histidine kinase [Deltaproteobacteria bacterium]|nr:two-component sensor histidine kinase [Deltaproteobacteria bacterium]
MNDEHRYRSLRRLVLACMILVPAVPFIAALVIGYSHFTSALETGTIASMKRIVADHRHMLETFLDERRADLELIAASYTFEELAWPRSIQEVFRDLQTGSNAFVDLGVFNEAGVHMAYFGPYQLTGKVYREAAWFQEVMKRGWYVSDIFLGYRNVPHFVIAVVGEDESGRWVLRATVDSNLFNDLVKKVRIGRTGEAYIVNRNGLFQTERRSGGELMRSDPGMAEHVRRHPGIRTFIDKDPQGVEHLYATTWLEEKDWMLVVRQEKADAFKALRTTVYLVVLILLAGGTGIVLTAFVLTSRIVRRMERMDVEKDRLGEQLIRATRLAELGEMSAGFAHEINNPLQIIKSEQALIDTILDELRERGDLPASPDLEELRDSMEQISLQIERCSKITQAILKFGRESEPVTKDIDLLSFIPEVASMVEKKASVHGITLEEELEPNLPRIHGDPAQLQQVLLNLFNNAVDAVIARHGALGGIILVGARSRGDGQVAVTVQDNGCGISPDDLDKVFSPFFTTKPVGKGTGLGLSVCYGIVNSMGGTMEVDSEPGKGTTFTIILPAMSAPAGKAGTTVRDDGQGCEALSAA